MVPGHAPERPKFDLPALPPGPPPSLFRELIRRPTGKNGYEELLRAADTLRASKLYFKTEQLESAASLTLAFKRDVLRDPSVVRTLDLLRCGLAKPVFTPNHVASVPGSEIAAGTREGPAAESDIEQLWHKVVDAVGRVSPFTRSYLLEAHPVSFNRNLLVIGFDPEATEGR